MLSLIGGYFLNRLKELRKNSGKTQKEVFEATGIPIRSIQNWESGKRQINPESAKQLADYFGVDIAYLLGYSGDKKNEISDIEFNRLIWRYFDNFRGKEFDKGFLSKERSIVNDLNKIIEINEDTELSDDKKEEKISNLVNNLIRQFSLYSVFVREKIIESKNKND